MKKTTTSLLTAALAGTLSLATVTETRAAITYETIVQWGELGGEDIVTGEGNKSGQNALGTSYDDTAQVNPLSGTDGYYATSPSERTIDFYGAQSAAFGGGVFVNVGGPADYAQLVANVGPSQFDVMAAWDIKDGFLNSQPGPVLESFTMEWQPRGDANTTVSFLLETSSGWYVTDTVQTVTDGSWSTFTLDVSNYPLAPTETWSSFSSFGVSGGGGAPDLNDIQSVGFFSTTTGNTSWSGLRLRHFEVTAAVPEPSSTALLGLGLSSLLLRRKRS